MRLQTGNGGAIVGAYLLLHKAQVEIIQIGYEVQSMVEVATLLLFFVGKEVGNVEIPRHEQLLLLRIESAWLDKCRVDGLGRELQGSQQIL